MSQNINFMNKFVKRTGLLCLLMICMFSFAMQVFADGQTVLAKQYDAKAVHWYNQGVEALQAKKYDTALEALTQAVKIEPRYYQAYDKRGDAYAAKSNFQSAAADYGKAADYCQPLDAGLYHKQGLAYSLYGDLQKALPCYDLAIRLNPAIPVFYYDRAIAENLSGDSGRAVNDLTTAVKLDDKYTEARYARGVIYGQRAEYDLAYADFDAVVKALPNDYRAYYWRGKISFLQGNRDAATKDYNKAAKLSGAELPFYSK